MAGATPALCAQDLQPAPVAPDAVVDAVTCRTSDALLPVLVPLLRALRPTDFTQSYRQYASPSMDLYRLLDPVAAWGQHSDSILIADDRVLMAVEGEMDEVARVLEETLQAGDSPLAGSLDQQHALVIMESMLPGLEGMVLLGCEYRHPGITLLSDPEQAWRTRASGTPVQSAPAPPPSDVQPPQEVAAHGTPADAAEDPPHAPRQP